MDNYGMDMQGSILVEKVQERGQWTPADLGRFIYEISTRNYWLAADTDQTEYGGWIPVGLQQGILKSTFIDWDTDLTGDTFKISAQTIPVLYGDEKTNIQQAFDSLLDEISALARGDILQAGSIRNYHIDTVGTFRIDARILPIENLSGYFPSSVSSIEDALSNLANKTADQVLIKTDTEFGSFLGLETLNVEAALTSLENYLSTIKADTIDATYPLVPDKTNVQFVLDALYELATKGINFTDLIGTPNDYGVLDQILKSDGNSAVCWGTLVANDIFAQYPDSTESNVQEAIWGMSNDIIALQNLHEVPLDATNITLDATDNYSNVSLAVMDILTTWYSPTNPPASVDVPTSGVETTTNVHDALLNLQTRINDIVATLPCTVGAEEVSYNSSQGHANVKTSLDWLFNSQVNVVNDFDVVNVSNSNLQTAYDTLSESHDTLQTNHDTLRNEFDILVEDFNALSEAFNTYVVSHP